ncbi:hypothetical protein AVEN_49552-1 [Araneus ventricosus]|uniref:Uncharacterized protein n=1 Tax=Araneus ventricosus TaxID=182803 RepID=A0A4Y2VRF6_ARAVE|nr:hypothetical protein AVEN_49552-1 [Araneus ventricosus]
MPTPLNMSASTSDTFEKACVFHSCRRQYFASIGAYSTHPSPTYPNGCKSWEQNGEEENHHNTTTNIAAAANKPSISKEF